MTATPPHEGLQALFAELKAEPWAHDFFALMRRLESLQPQAPRIGMAQRPSQEALRLGQDAELDFAPAAVASFGNGRGTAPRLGVRFFGMLGPQGPMPLHFSEYVRDRLRNHSDPTLARFLDIFHHRMLSLFYRSWAHTQPVVHRDRPETDRYGAWLGAQIGLNAGTRGRGSVPDAAKLHQAGLLSNRSRHPEGLGKLLSHYFAVPVRVQSHVAHWMVIAHDDRSRLGFARGRMARPAASRLGHSATAGSKVWDRQFKFRIELGPLTLKQYLSFLPGSPAWLQLADWVRLYVGLDKVWDVQLCLQKQELPAPRLGRHMRLGLTSWAASNKQPPRDRNDLHLRPETSFLLRTTGNAHG